MGFRRGTAPELPRGRRAVRGPEPFFTERDCAEFEKPGFEDFPYLVVHPVMGINHIILLPDRLARRTLLWIAEQQRAANRMPVSLALWWGDWMHLPAKGGASGVSKNPFPGFPLTGDIQPCARFPRTFATRASERRIASLELFIRRNPIRGFQFGEPWRGGRWATMDEAQWLFGRQASGAPAGLRECSECGDWKGKCLDPSLSGVDKQDFVVHVRCRCDNWNRCARCHRTLEGRRLNSNYYDPRDGKIWFVSGLNALDHRC